MNEYKDFESLPKNIQRTYFRYAKLKSKLNDINGQTSEKVLEKMESDFIKIMDQTKHMGNSPFMASFRENTEATYKKAVKNIEDLKIKSKGYVDGYKDALAAAVEDLGNRGEYVKGLHLRLANVSENDVRKELEKHFSNREHYSITSSFGTFDQGGGIYVAFPDWYPIESKMFDVAKNLKAALPDIEFMGADNLDFEALLEDKNLSAARASIGRHMRDSIFMETPALIPQLKNSESDWMLANGDVYSEEDIEAVVLQEIIEKYTPEFGKDYDIWENNALSYFKNEDESSFSM